ncbi:hypothetical protein VPH35_110519 [Triticum aestivum]
MNSWNLNNSEHTDPESQSACSRKVGNFFIDGVQLPVDNSCLINSVCSVPGYQNDLTVTNVDDMLKSTTEDNCSKGILMQDNALHFFWEARPEQQEDIYNRESTAEIPTRYQVQEHAAKCSLPTPDHQPRM